MKVGVAGRGAGGAAVLAIPGLRTGEVDFRLLH